MRRVSPRGGYYARACVAASGIRLRAAAGEVAMAEKTTPDENNPIARRNFLLGASTAVAAGLAPPAAAEAQQPPAPAGASAPANEPSTHLTLTETEVAFFTAAADAMIPADELTPSGSDCGIVTFIDRQLASAWGGGAKMYRNGPFRKAKPEYGYQLPLTPRQLFAAGVVATNAWTRKVYGKDFDRLAAKEREDALKVLEQGKAELDDFDGKIFFEALLQIVMEGFFADPIYGGNRNKVSWRMIGFPGLPAVYSKLIEEYRNKAYVAEPQSIADFS
jgi:gluconate 2-dehydrogenase gamma chain